MLELKNRPWIDSPFFEQALEAKGLDPETKRLVRFYAENGYVIVDPEVTSPTIDALNGGLAERFRPNMDGYYADETRVQDAWLFNEHVRNVAVAPRIVELLRIFYGREPIPFQTLNFRVGSQQRTHSDIIHFDSFPYGYMCGVWTALEDVDLRNGPLHYYHASHRMPRFDMHDIGITAAGTVGYEKYHLYEDFVEQLMKERRGERVELKLERGQALIWSANLFHGGSPIVDNGRTRLSQVTHFYFSGCMYYTPLFSDVGLGKIVTRNVHDIRTRRPVPQFYNGVEIANPGQWPPQELPPWGAVPTRTKRSVRGIRDAIARLLRP
ncbi:MAG TPA: phytanoyl-CoA dioxygenase family protein [Thermoanaerobaculia bacterium]|nr:phytanoyl-CoA dioxygenase family protein [Thermoanaerobaculia bacterium]